MDGVEGGMNFLFLGDALAGADEPCSTRGVPSAWQTTGLEAEGESMLLLETLGHIFQVRRRSNLWHGHCRV